MPKQMPPLTWFRAFDAAARHLNFTAAAEDLGLTQSAVSQHVRSLEQRFGVKLFNRHARGITLTDEGRRLFPDVTRAIDTFASLSEAYDNRAEGRILTIAASVSVIQWYLAPGLAAFRADWPDIAVRFINTTWPDEFNVKLADVEIRYGAASLVGRDAIRLEPDELVVVASPGIAADTVLAQPLIQAVGTSDSWAHWSRSTGIDVPREPSLLVDSHGLAVDLARRGTGTALTSSLIAAPSLRDGTLTRADLPSTPSIDGYYLANNSEETPAARAFAAWFTDRIAQVAAAQ
ncbi:LysR family transcriptional regulator [Hwanghaeella sp.]|uniref:LysR family transcriptional regulator n=1 Tax=Hwanghaeella sp. TaxID=2605943 RepID=UPI003CCC3D89